MPTKEKLRQRLIAKLEELFQLDQPDLDFGFYRIMHAKAEQVRSFLENDLLAIIGEAFSQEGQAAAEAKLEGIRKKVTDTLGAEAIDGDGNLLDAYRETPVGKEYLAAQAAAARGAGAGQAEGEIYDHLYRFFERYYEGGDFISRRYYTRETPGKAAPYAIPYNGEEVKLHWANADQYYIKTTEYFANFTFDLRQAKEVQQRVEEGDLFAGQDGAPVRAHFQIADATEGEHGNVKASADQKRFFILHHDDPVGFNEAGELVCRFEYRPDPEKSGQENTWRDKRNAEALEAILAKLHAWAAGKEDPPEGGRDRAQTYLDLLSTPAPTEKQKDRPLLARYLNQYTGRNTMDYFIHKDLGGFLRRELDFYIKNEIMRLDDIESADAPRVEAYLRQIKVLRRIAGKIIEFLAHLEEFQKKLWLKKKFVVETNYCITLDRIPEEFYPEIAANDAQREEWVRLLGIDLPPKSMSTIELDKKTRQFFRDNPCLAVDTGHFPKAVISRMLANLATVDEACFGYLLQSENSQGLRFLRPAFLSRIESVYIDPPYNAAATEIAYKNGYKSSSWSCLLHERLALSKALMSESSVLCETIDDYELDNMKKVSDDIFLPEAHLATVPIRNNPSGRSTVSGFAICHEYALFYARDIERRVVGRLQHSEQQLDRYDQVDAQGRQFEWENFRKSSAGSYRGDRPKQFYPLYVDPETSAIRVPEASWNDPEKKWIITEAPAENEIAVYPMDSSGQERVWNFGLARTQSTAKEMKVENRDGKVEIYKKKYLQREGTLPRTWWDKAEYSARDNGTRALKNLFGGRTGFDFPKAVAAVSDCIKVSGLGESGWCLDYFAGSGTTGQAIVEMNRADDGDRRMILIEMGEHFDTVLLPRIKKVLYASEWREGLPTSEDTGLSHCFKYIRLESYEDCLNNLTFADDPVREKVLAGNPGLREDHMLRYLLDVETRGSASLLNVDGFKDPEGYRLKVKKPGSDEYEWKNVDLLETFNWLIGLRVQHIAAPETFSTKFKREKDPELPEDSHTKLVIDGRLKKDEAGPWWFRTVEGWVPRDPMQPDGDRDKVLIVWRKLTDDLEQDNAVLDAWFARKQINTRDSELDIVYVNGSNNLPNLQTEEDHWKVRLIEEDFHRLMWDVEDV